MTTANFILLLLTPPAGGEVIPPEPAPSEVSLGYRRGDDPSPGISPGGGNLRQG